MFRGRVGVASVVLLAVSLLHSTSALRFAHHHQDRIHQGPANSSFVVCPLNSSVNVAYFGSVAGGVDEASTMWVDNFFSWWADYDPSIVFVSLDALQIQACSFSEYSDTLRLFMNPGGSAVPQLMAYGAAGVYNIKQWMGEQPYSGTSKIPHVYVGICAGGYLASRDYIWETQYFGDAYFASLYAPLPLGLFPYRLEGSVVDIADDQYGNYDGKGDLGYRMVNVTNVVNHSDTDADDEEELEMLYYGGFSFGWNAVPDYTLGIRECKKSEESGEEECETTIDPLIQPLLYYSDFYGYNSPNLPAMFQYGDYVLLSSIHPEADDSVCATDCPPEGTLTPKQIDANYRYFAQQMNRMMGNPFKIPPPSTNVTSSSSSTFSVAKKDNSDRAVTRTLKAPHDSYPTLDCYSTASILFCDDFTVPSSLDVFPGMFQWQRNQTYYYLARPWNVTFTGILLASGYDYYGDGVKGPTDGWAVAIPIATTTVVPYPSVITSKPIVIVPSTNSSANPAFTYVILSYFFKGVLQVDGYFSVEYTCNDFAQTWYTLRRSSIYTTVLNTTDDDSDKQSRSFDPEVERKRQDRVGSTFAWYQEKWSLAISSASTTCGTKYQPLQFRFACYTGYYGTFGNFCGLDNVQLQAY